MSELIARLEDEDPRVRADAAAELVERCRSDAEARGRFGMRFLTLLNDDSPAVRGHAVVGAVLCDDELAHLERVVRLLADPSPGVRLQVIYTVGPLGLPQLFPVLQECLGDCDLHVRTAAASALAFAGQSSAIPTLLAGLEHRATREDALHALRQVASAGERGRVEQAARKIFGGFFVNRFERAAAAGVLAALGCADGSAYLVERLRKRGSDRPVAMELCGELRIGEAEVALRQAAGDRRDSLRGTALRALASLGAGDAVERCGAALLDDGEDPDLRCDAAEGLLLFGGSEAESLLEKAEQSVTEPRVLRVVRGCLALRGKPPREIRLFLPLSGDEVV